MRVPLASVEDVDFPQCCVETVGRVDLAVERFRDKADCCFVENAADCAEGALADWLGVRGVRLVVLGCGPLTGRNSIF